MLISTTSFVYSLNVKPTRQQKKARIGQEVVSIALQADPSLQTRYSTISNWRQGVSLPRLEEFLHYCKASGTNDISNLLKTLSD